MSNMKVGYTVLAAYLTICAAYIQEEKRINKESCRSTNVYHIKHYQHEVRKTLNVVNNTYITWTLCTIYSKLLTI